MFEGDRPRGGPAGPFPRKAMILAAGLGTRLRPLTESIPKPAVPICGIPPLRWNLSLLASAGVEEVVINTHWQSQAIEAAVGDASSLGLEVHFSHEPKILGTGGGLRKAAGFFRDETFYVVNGKVLFDADLRGAASFHRERSSIATMVLRPQPDQAERSSVEIDDEGLIRRLRGEGETQASASLTRCLFTGVHVLEPRALEYLPDGGPACIIADGYMVMMRSGEVLSGHLQPDEYFAEPSTPRRYLMAALDVIDGRVGLERFRAGGVDPFAGCQEMTKGVFVHSTVKVDSSAILEPPCWIGKGAAIEQGAVVGPRALVEQEATIGEGARVKDSVVWPRSRIEAGELVEGIIAAGGDRVDARD